MSDDVTTSVSEYRKRIVEKVELAQNLARDNLHRSKQKLKEYYDQNSKEPIFEVGQPVWVYTPKSKKGLSKKLLHRWFGPYRIVEQSSPVHYRLRTQTNKNVTFAIHANRMKPYYDPDLRPIDPPLVDDPGEPYLEESDIPEDSFETEQTVSWEGGTQSPQATPVISQP